MEKILSFDALSQVVREWRALNPKKKVALCHGCFDIVHPGHIRHLNSAKDCADLLVVSITPDSHVNKGVGRPFVPEALRLNNLEALSFVDYVVAAPGETAIEVIEALRPDSYVKGGEYSYSKDPRFLVELKAVQSYGGKAVYTSGDVVFSSTQIIRNCRLDSADQEKIRFICKQHGITYSLMHDVVINAREKRVVVIGECILNELNHCEGIGISPASPILSLSLKHSERNLGGAGMAAANLASLGVDVVFLTSCDSRSTVFGEFSEAMTAAGVEIVNVDDPARSMVVKSKFIVDRHKVLEVDNGAHHPLDSKIFMEILDKVDVVLQPGVNALIYSDFGYGLLTEVLLNDIVERAASQGILVAGDLSTTLRTQIGKFYNATLFLPTEMELRACFHDYESGLSVLVDRFYQVTRVRELYMALNDRSVMYFKKAVPGFHTMETVHFPPLTKNCEDKSGLDDAFLVGVVLGRVFGATEAQSTYFGALCAAVHGERIGGMRIHADDIYRVMDERPELR